MAGKKIDSSGIVKFQHGKLIVNTQKTPLGKILDEIHRKCMVEIVGLESRENEFITFSSKEETLEDVLKRLLRQLNENNYAFEFNNSRLVKVSVLPKSKTSVSSHPVRKSEKKTNGKLVSAVMVQNVVEGTQAEELELKKGDLIISYDGVKTISSRQLVREVKKKSDKDNIELIVVRDRETMKLFVKGGLIGVNINTVKISEEEVGE